MHGPSENFWVLKADKRNFQHSESGFKNKMTAQKYNIYINFQSHNSRKRVEVVDWSSCFDVSNTFDIYSNIQ